jgi:predicted Zn-ribbon and HTH transcriptional regulator
LQRTNSVVQKLRCEKCGHEWIPRVENPWKCPRCQHVPGVKIRKSSSAAYKPLVTLDTTVEEKK